MEENQDGVELETMTEVRGKSQGGDGEGSPMEDAESQRKGGDGVDVCIYI